MGALCQEVTKVQGTSYPWASKFSCTSPTPSEQSNLAWYANWDDPAKKQTSKALDMLVEQFGPELQSPWLEWCFTNKCQRKQLFHHYIAEIPGFTFIKNKIKNIRCSFVRMKIQWLSEIFFYPATSQTMRPPQGGGLQYRYNKTQ